MRIRSFVIGALFVLASAAGFCAEPVDGEQLVRQIWGISAAGQWAEHESLLSPAFQSLHAFGAVDKAREMELLQKVDFKEFELSDFKTTRLDNVVIVTYSAGVIETIRGERQTARHAPRMSIFIMTDTGWQWLAHAVIQTDKHGGAPH